MDTLQHIRIKYMDPHMLPVKQFVPGSDWIDLRSRTTLKLKEGEYVEIPLGVAMELPAGYEAHVRPRSSTFRNYGILMTNSMGVIDESYCGDDDEWHFPAYCTRDCVIHANDRICQFRIVEHQPGISFEEVPSLGNPSRGGLGSTGTK